MNHLSPSILYLLVKAYDESVLAWLTLSSLEYCIKILAHTVYCYHQIRSDTWWIIMIQQMHGKDMVFIVSKEDDLKNEVFFPERRLETVWFYALIEVFPFHFAIRIWDLTFTMFSILLITPTFLQNVNNHAIKASLNYWF